MPRSPAEELKLESRRLRVAELYCRGMTNLTAIAAEIGVHKAQISRDFAVIKKTWKDRYADVLNDAKWEEVEKWNLLERTYWQAWDRSCKNAETRTAKVAKGADKKKKDGTVVPGTPRTETVHKEVGQSGDPAYLQGVERCIKERCKLLGLIVDKIAPTNPTGTDEYSAGGFEPDEVASILERVAARLGIKPIEPGGGEPEVPA